MHISTMKKQLTFKPYIQSPNDKWTNWALPGREAFLTIQEFWKLSDRGNFIGNFPGNFLTASLPLRK